MNDINDDYLWDRTGEPDPEIQQLEQLLGTLRYQPRPLEIPLEPAPVGKRALFPRFLAIAATIAIMLLGVGLWVALRRQPTAPVAVVDHPKKAEESVADVPTPSKDSVAPPKETIPGDKPVPHRRSPGAFSNELARHRRPIQDAQELTPEERLEAAVAKEQLILALRVASSKLSFAQKKAQEINSDNMVHNQHKIG